MPLGGLVLTMSFLSPAKNDVISCGNRLHP
jgi:hypothetical protein